MSRPARRWLRLAAALLGLALLAAVAFLGAAHLQTRRIAPALPTDAELLSLLEASDGPVAVESVVVAEQTTPRGSIAHTVFVARWADGRAFLIDLGMDRAGAAEFAALMQRLSGAADHRFHGDVAEGLGAAIRDVAGVGFTHLHIDHVQGLGAFCAARGAGARVVRTRWQAEVHNVHTREGAGLVAASCLEAHTEDGEGLLPVEGFPGLGMVALGGHTPGSTLFALAVGERLWLFPGDTTNTKESLLRDVGKGFLYSVVLVPENTARTAELRRWLARLDARDEVTVVVSHDAIAADADGLPRFGAAPPSERAPSADRAGGTSGERSR